MIVTEVCVQLNTKLSEGNGKLKAFCSIVIDGCIVIRDLKVIEGVRGLFVAMPSRKLADRCPRCESKNQLLARFCNQCGTRLSDNRIPPSESGPGKLHADIAHPITTEARRVIENAVLTAYQAETQKASQPGYVPERLVELS